MERRAVTASAIILLSEKLEDESSMFYEKMAEMYEKDREIFFAFAEEGKRNKLLISRTYIEAISDALEACFSFKDVALEDFSIEATLEKDMDYSDALRAALTLEEKASRFYLDLVECSKSLLSTILRAFRKVAETRKNRKDRLILLLERGKSDD